MVKSPALAVLLLLFGALQAQADNDMWVPSGKKSLSDAALQGATDYCTQTVGPNLNGRPTSARFKQCMLSRGWRFVRTVRERPVHTWVDEDGLILATMKAALRIVPITRLIHIGAVHSPCDRAKIKEPRPPC